MFINGLNIVICQMNVVCGRPDLNANYIIEEINKAAKAGADIIIFPEMCVPGYFIGDLPEDESFVKDCVHHNERIRSATGLAGITAIWGSFALSVTRKKGEDGRLRKYNAACIAQDGCWKNNRIANGFTVKTLFPKYRIFSDERHFFSMRQVAEENELDVHDLLEPFTLEIRDKKVKIGLILCEDMWHEDYYLDPTRILFQKGSELIINLSCSPWSWQKNRKRHQVVRDILKECPVPFIYVNNTGIQNTGKNILIFDGSSCVYNEKGEVSFEIPPYRHESSRVFIRSKMPAIGPKKADDAQELFSALENMGREFFRTFPASRRKMVIGLSGGIDSAATSAYYTHLFGPENVIAVNMPSKFNSQKTKDIAGLIAANLRAQYRVIPIQGMVDEIAKSTGVEPETLEYENLQAVVRMNILRTISQKEGAFFSANCNKVELAFGYSTLYGDMAGVMAILGDLIKREVYQLCDYMNRQIYRKEVIPRECFEIKPSAELSSDQNIEAGKGDPFDYGTLHRRGYHDELVRAFTEFRQNPEYVLELYVSGRLEKEWLLEQGLLKKLFPRAKDFIADLERCWDLFHRAYFKRVQSAPIPVVSKRAFGTDLREAMLPAHFTERYKELKGPALRRERPKEDR